MKCRWKSPTRITKVADTNHLNMSRCLQQSPWQVRDKPVCVALTKFSPLQCTGKVGDKVCDKVRDKVRDKFQTKLRTCRGHKSWKSTTRTFHDLCLQQVRDFVRNLSRTLLQSRRDGIWALGVPMDGGTQKNTNCFIRRGKNKLKCNQLFLISSSKLDYLSIHYSSAQHHHSVTN